MQPEIIKAVYKEDKECVELNFQINPTKNISVHLTSPDVQKELKELFCVLLEVMIRAHIKIELDLGESPPQNLFTDVCGEYIEELNRELEQVYKDFAADIGISDQ